VGLAAGAAKVQWVVPWLENPSLRPTPSPQGPYSHAVDADPYVYLSGQTPMDAATGRLIEGSVADQTRQCFTNLFAVLTAAGLGSDDVVKCNVYLTNMADFAEMNQVYAEQFTKAVPRAHHHRRGLLAPRRPRRNRAHCPDGPKTW